MNNRILYILLLVSCIYVTQAQPVAKHGALHVEGTQLKDSAGNAVVLRGMSFGWHNFWPRFYTAGTVNSLSKEWGCTVVRAAMGVEPANGYIEKPEWSKDKIKTVVDAAIKEGIYVIIDWHSHNIRLKEANAFFAEMAAAYGKYPNIIYELFNEPDEETWHEVKAYSEKLISTIRASDKNNIILVGCPHWDQDVHLPALDPIKNVTNVMYTMHFYAATHKQYLRTRCDEALAKGLPIFISESAGMEATGDGPLNEPEWNKWITWAEAKKISWVTWSVSDKDESCSVLQKTASSDGKWSDKDLKLSGLKTKALIKKYTAADQ